jgi:hypothetical protein
MKNINPIKEDKEPEDPYKDISFWEAFGAITFPISLTLACISIIKGIIGNLFWLIS